MKPETQSPAVDPPCRCCGQPAGREHMFPRRDGTFVSGWLCDGCHDAWLKSPAHARGMWGSIAREFTDWTETRRREFANGQGARP